jgi:UDP-N-acetylmuramate dehydrogenase
MPLGPLIEKLKKAFGDKVRENAPLASLTTYNIGGPAELLFTPENEEDLQLLMGICAGHDIGITVIGGGSNMLIADGGIRGITIWMDEKFSEIEADKHDDYIDVTCGSSLPLADVIEFCIAQDIGGIEFASGVPGSVGGAIRGNAGTRDGAIGGVVEHLTYINEGGARIEKSRDDLNFQYRSLRLEGRFVITKSVLRLKHGDGNRVREKRDKIVKWRKTRQPYDLPSAGCVFVNPDTCSAGRLIEEAGCKGMRVGGAEVSDKHANFIVNNGNATAKDVLELVDQVRRKVFDKSGVLLETELRVVGESK